VPLLSWEAHKGPTIFSSPHPFLDEDLLDQYLFSFKMKTMSNVVVIVKTPIE
jgi:hypothetical protein